MAQNPPTITLEWVEQQEALHKKKLASLAVIKQALLDIMEPEPAVGHQVPVSRPAAAPTQGTTFTKLVVVLGKKKRTILRYIADSIIGRSTQDIVSHCVSEGLKETNQANTSPQLSLYKQHELIELKDGLWTITPKGRAWLSEQKI